MRRRPGAGGRSRSPLPGAAQPARQRDQIHAPRWTRDGICGRPATARGRREGGRRAGGVGYRRGHSGCSTSRGSPNDSTASTGRARASWAAPAWAWRSSSISFSSMRETSKSRAGCARAPRCGSRCRCRLRRPRGSRPRSPSPVNAAVLFPTSSYIRLALFALLYLSLPFIPTRGIDRFGVKSAMNGNSVSSLLPFLPISAGGPPFAHRRSTSITRNDPVTRLRLEREEHQPSGRKGS